MSDVKGTRPLAPLSFDLAVVVILHIYICSCFIPLGNASRTFYPIQSLLIIGDRAWTRQPMHTFIQGA